MVEAPPMVLLFDIDGTLIDSAGAGGGALLRAFQEGFMIDQAQPVALHGRTDLGIMTELLENHEIVASEGNLRRLCELYFASLPDELSRRGGSTLPGVQALLPRLTERGGCRIGLLTGNMPISARLKLEHFGLWHHFEFGIFGDRALHRPLLAEPALEFLAAEVMENLPPQNIVIVGDTPLDMELAVAMQVRSLAVCTGGFSCEELQRAGASRTCVDLGDTESIVSWLLQPV